MRGEITITYFGQDLDERTFFTLAELLDEPVVNLYEISAIIQLPDNDEDVQHLKMGTKTVDDIATEHCMKNIINYMSEAPKTIVGAEAFLIIAEEGIEYQVECLFEDVDTAVLLHGSTIKEWEENNGARIISCEKETIH